MPATIQIKHALFTIDNPPLGAKANPLPDYLIEIQYDLDNKPVKLWIHDSTGRTIIRIQSK